MLLRNKDEDLWQRCFLKIWSSDSLRDRYVRILILNMHLSLKGTVIRWKSLSSDLRWIKAFAFTWKHATLLMVAVEFIDNNEKVSCFIQCFHNSSSRKLVKYIRCERRWQVIIYLLYYSMTIFLFWFRFVLWNQWIWFENLFFSRNID